MEERTQEEIEWYMERFLGFIQEYLDQSMHRKTSGKRLLEFSNRKVRAKKGRVYWAIWVDVEDLSADHSFSRVFGFVRRKDGAIFKAATWRGPETRTKNPIRGYIWEEEAKSTFTWTGVL